ncbi:unnamed protein product [Rangifer tarandus platyrhynchus]|uniref:Uncharacterized protein n=1 Tax=Rangifer tarandus platyrhynchus TaxID=3082113 RepID=A0AC59Z1C0_RANTA
MNQCSGLLAIRDQAHRKERATFPAPRAVCPVLPATGVGKVLSSESGNKNTSLLLLPAFFLRLFTVMIMEIQQTCLRCPQGPGSCSSLQQERSEQEETEEVLN